MVQFKLIYQPYSPTDGIMKWKEEGAQEDVIIARLRPKTVPSGYMPTTWIPEVWCGRLCLLISKIVVGLDKDYMYVHACNPHQDLKERIRHVPNSSNQFWPC